MPIPPFAGHFVECTLRKDASTPLDDKARATPMTGGAFRKWVDGQTSRDGAVGSSVPSERFPEEIVYRVGRKYFPKAFPLQGPSGGAGDDEASFIYLDVGAWIGSAQEDGGFWWKFDNYQRDWGIICGPHVLLCTFEKLPHAPTRDDDGWTKALKPKNGKADTGVTSIQALLSVVRKRTASTHLGGPRVARYLRAAPSVLIKKEKNWVVHVIMGDMHVPVVDKLEQTQPMVNGKRVSVPMPWVDVYNEFVARDDVREKLRREVHLDESDAKRLVLWQKLDDGYVKDELSHPILPEALESDPGWKALRGQFNDWAMKQAQDGGASSLLWPSAQEYLIRETVDGLIDRRSLPIRTGASKERYLRMGRIDIGPLVDLIINRLKIGVITADNLNKLIPAIQHLAKIAMANPKDVVDPKNDEELKKVLGPVFDDVKAWRDNQDFLGVSNGTMTKEDAEAWFHFYRTPGVAVEAVMPPADICEKAGLDFELFADALGDYRKQNPDSLALQFHQLGDMIDLWIGFSCHYLPAGTDATGMTPTNSGIPANTKLPIHLTGHPQERESTNNGETMARYWVNNCLSETEQGKAISRGVSTLESLDFPPHFLYGNHDNYLGGINVVYGTEKRSLGQRYSHFPPEEGGIRMEHGHQWEAANADNAPLLPFTSMLVGTDSPLGEFVTQAAFIRPAPIRAVGDQMDAALTQITNPTSPSGSQYGYRLKQMAYAADKAMNEGSFYAYAMGHTHSPCLCRVRMWPNDVEARREEIEARQNTRPSHVWPYFDKGDDPIPENPWPNNSAFVVVEWKGMLARENHDWVALDDRAWTKGTRRHGFWKWVGDGDIFADFRHKFPKIPAGRYVARAYLDVHDQPVQPDSIWIDVPGISIEPEAVSDYADDKEPDPAVILVRGGVPMRPIVLRFTDPALDTHALERFVFVLSTAHDASMSNDAFLQSKKVRLMTLDDIAGSVEARRYPFRGAGTPFYDFLVDQYKHGSTSFVVTWLFFADAANANEKPTWTKLGSATLELKAVH